MRREQTNDTSSCVAWIGSGATPYYSWTGVLTETDLRFSKRAGIIFQLQPSSASATNNFGQYYSAGINVAVWTSLILTRPRSRLQPRTIPTTRCMWRSCRTSSRSSRSRSAVQQLSRPRGHLVLNLNVHFIKSVAFAIFLNIERYTA